MVDEPMNANVKALWVEALRSGKFTQGPNSLRKVEGPKESHCCLGVLCDLAVERGVIEPPVFVPEEDCYSYGYDGHTAFLPADVREWAGISSSNGRYLTGENEVMQSLVSKNDDGHTFAEIAEIIEREF